MSNYKAINNNDSAHINRIHVLQADEHRPIL
jgi:hypothetical protein